MKQIMLGVFLIFLWILGIYEGDCTLALGVTIFAMFPLLEIVIAMIKWQIHKKAVRR